MTMWDLSIKRGERGGGAPPPRITTNQAGRRLLTGVVLVLLFMLSPTVAVAADSWTATAPAVVYGIATNADGSLVVSGRRDNMVVAYDASGQEVWSFATQGTVYDVSVSSDGQRIAVASEDRHVYLLDGDGKELWNYRGAQTFLSVSITGDGAFVAAGSEDRTVSLFDSSGALKWQYTAGDHVTQVAIYGGKKGYRVVAGSRDSRVALLGSDGKALWQTTLNYTVRGLSVTSNGATVVAGDNRSTLYLLDGASGAITWQAALGSPVNAVGVSKDGQTIVAGSDKGEFAVFDAKGDKTSSTQVGGSFNDLALNGDASFAVIANNQQVAVYPRNSDGSFAAPKQASKLWTYIGIAVAIVAVIVLIGFLFGLRKRPDGDRVWHGFVREKRTLAHDVWKSRVSYLFLLPTITLLLVFNYYPAISGIIHAFTIWTPGIETKWVGLDQFRELSHNRYFWTGIGNLLILIGTGFLKLLIPLIIAEMVFHLRNSKVQYAFRTLFVLQIIVPGVVGILLWVNVYDPNIGLANQVLRSIGLGNYTRFWLGDSSTAIWSIVFMGFPWVSAFALLIFYGGLISIPGELFDAAALDGASTLRRIINVDLPLLLGQIRLLLILTFIAMVQEFSAVFLTTGGGPGSSTYVPSLELYYQAVRFNNFGMASAIGAVLFLVILGGTIINLRYVKSSVEYST
jgi:ABC-type sugar transport system permease subunit